MTEKLRWGLLSTAKINAALFKPLAKSKRNTLFAVGSRSEASAQAYALEHDIPRAHGSYEALLADPDVDVIYNSLPNHLHAEWTIKALEAGKHVLCEKPFALTLAEVDAMSAAAQRTGKVLAEAFMYRTHPQTHKVKEIVTGSAFGKILTIKGGFTFTFNRPGNYRLDPAYGGGALWDVGCYPVSYARTMLGLEPLEVFGWQVTAESGIDEFFSGQLRFPGDILATLSCGMMLGQDSALRLWGSQGHIPVPSPWFVPEDGEIMLHRKGQAEPEHVPVHAGAPLYTIEDDTVAASVADRQGPSPCMTWQDTLGNMQTLDRWRHDPLVTITLDPHAVYTCSPELLTRLGAMSRDEGALYVIHLAENEEELRACRERY